jgi:hypothetical protein
MNGHDRQMSIKNRGVKASNLRGGIRLALLAGSLAHAGVTEPGSPQFDSKRFPKTHSAHPELRCRNTTTTASLMR